MGREKQRKNSCFLFALIFSGEESWWISKLRLKYGLSDKPAPKNQEQLQANIESHMEMLKGNKERVLKYFKHQDIKYAAWNYGKNVGLIV